MAGRARPVGVVWLPMAVLATAWGSTFFWIHVALDAGVSPGLVTFGRCVVAAGTLLLLGWPRWRRRGERGPALRHLVVAALLCNAIPFSLFSLGQQTVPSGVAGVLNATTPLWAALLTVAGGGRLGRVQVAGVLTGFGGVVVIFSPDVPEGAFGWDAGMLALAASCYALAFVFMSRHLLPTGASPAELAAVQMSVAAVLCGLALPLYPTPLVVPTGVGLLAVVALGVVCTALTFAITYRMLASEGPTNTAVVTYLLPVVAVTIGALVLHEPLTAGTTLGMVVILLGIALTRRGR